MTEAVPRPGSGMSLTSEDMRKHAEVMSAIVSELQTWLKFGCFKRRPRHGARNIMEFVPYRTDNELLILYENGSLVALMCIHVDDLKLAG